MEFTCRVGLLSAIVLWPLANHAAEPEPGEVARQLRIQGFDPTKSPAVCIGRDSRPVYRVSGDITRPVITLKTTPNPGHRTALRGRRFHYSSVDHGEFGGTLFVREGDGPQRSLMQTNVVDLVPAGKNLLVFAGLAHVSMSSGDIWVVEAYDSAPKLRFLTQLPEKPDVIAEDPETHRIAIVSEFSVSELWGDFYSVLTARHHRFPHASSAVVSRPNILIGICGGVALLEFPWRRNLPPALDGSDQITIVTYWTRR
jgi:hypothetical protein